MVPSRWRRVSARRRNGPARQVHFSKSPGRPYVPVRSSGQGTVSCSAAAVSRTRRRRTTSVCCHARRSNSATCSAVVGAPSAGRDSARVPAPARPRRQRGRARSGATCRPAAGPRVSHPSRSRLRLRAVDRDRNGAAAFVIVEPVDARTGCLVQPDHLGAPGKAALLMSLDEGEATRAFGKEIGGAGSVGKHGRGAK